MNFLWDVLILGGWNREVPLYTEVSSFRGLEEREVSLAGFYWMNLSLLLSVYLNVSI